LCHGDPACARACPVDAIEWVEAPVSDWLGQFAEERAVRDLLAVSPGGA